MLPRIEATSALETRLARVFLSELLGSRVDVEYVDADDTQVDVELVELELDGHDDYDFYEVVAAPVSDVDATFKVARVHDTTQDHIVTVPFAREAITAPFPKYSAPYELIDIRDCSIGFVRVDPVVEPPREAPPAGLNVNPDDDWFDSSAVEIIIEPDHNTEPAWASSRQVVIFGALVCAFTVGLSVLLFAL